MHQIPNLKAGVASRRAVIAGLAGVSALPALAQFRVEVTGVGMRQIPITIAPFRGEGSSSQKISQIIQADLERSGLFKSVPATGEQLDENARPDLNAWRQRSVDDLVAGSVNALPGGRFEVRFRLWDVIRGQDLGGQSYTIAAADLRLAAHRAADYIYEKITGEKGVFATRLAFVTRSGQRYGL
ncbi:MAG: Tol-Pal system protein TolB, partial [Comamonas sp.]